MHKRGFTIIELLVVIGIIGILAAAVIVGLNNSRLKARESSRLADLDEITSALELYVTAGNNYPAAATSTVVSTALAPLVAGGFLENMPSDPHPPGGNNPWCLDYTYVSPGTANYSYKGSDIGTRLYLLAFVSEMLGVDNADHNLNTHPLNNKIYLSYTADITNCTPPSRAGGIVMGSIQ